MRYEFELTSTTPLIMHADDLNASDQLTAWRKAPDNKKSPKGDDRFPAWTWQTYLYNDGLKVAMPSDNIMVCLRKAGTTMTLNGKKTYKSMSQSGMVIEQEFCEFTTAGRTVSIRSVEAFREESFRVHCEEATKLGFRLFAKRARIGKAKHVRVRPRYDSWAVRGTLLVSEEEALTKEVLEEMFYQAGKVGLGDWRPGCDTPGNFGMFEAKLKQIK